MHGGSCSVTSSTPGSHLAAVVPAAAIAAYRRWHANVRQLKFQRNRQRLAQQLLLLKLPYLKLLVDCRAKMGAILDAGALQPVAPGLYKLDALIEQQQEYQQ
jgi:hypothetical protein